MKHSSDQFNINLLDERLIWFFLIVVLSLFSCGTSEERSDYRGITGIIGQLPQLPEPYEYSMWLTENDNIRQMTTFNADDEGIFRLAAAPLAQFIEDMTEVVVSIEDSNESYEEPGNTQIVGARFTSQDQSDFKTYTIAGDFSLASAGFIVEQSGGGTMVFNTLRFVDEEFNSLFSIPNLNEAWRYELWIKQGDDYESLLRFADGELPQFFQHSEDLTYVTLMISLEPAEDYSDEPTGMFIFSAVVDLTDDVQELVRTDEFLPAGVITREK